MLSLKLILSTKIIKNHKSNIKYTKVIFNLNLLNYKDFQAKKESYTHKQANYPNKISKIKIFNKAILMPQ